jgi:2-oxoisovalerate dehydrogenase E2 component (dihydrolipoyl transacylase)
VRDFVLPDLGEGLTEAEIVSWRVAVGDPVEVDQVVVEVETAKAVVEVPVPFAGTVTSRHGEPGDVLKVGAPLITVEPLGLRESGTAEATASGNVLIGYGTPPPGARRHRPARPARTSAASLAAPPGASGQPIPLSERRPVAVISPLVRKLARDGGVDLRRLTGTGLDGVVLRRDVEHALADAAAPGDEQRIRLRGVRKAAADKVTRSRREIPEATVWVDVDATELLAARAVINHRIPGAPVSLLGLFARFAVLALRRYPQLNGRVDGDEIVLPSAVHLGLAAQTDRGLVVPVVHDAQRLTTRELAAQINDRTAAARAGTLTPADLTGGTFTVNNYGVFGVDGSAAIINHPEVAILGLGRIIERPWVVDGQLAVRQVGQLTLAFDHRVCDGGTASGFLRYVADCFESPVGALGDL